MLKVNYRKYQNLQKRKENNPKKCNICHGEIIIITKQTKSADEGMTNYYHCLGCNTTKKS
jgi:DNA-directed RNA polymerase subunit M/transcription elongation factor TFIIS